MLVKLKFEFEVFFCPGLASGHRQPALRITDGNTTRLHILETAGRLFAAQGFAESTSKEICTRAGTNMAAINYHFGGRDGLYEGGAGRSAQAAGERIDELMALSLESTDPRLKLRAFLTHMVEMSAQPEGAVGVPRGAARGAVAVACHAGADPAGCAAQGQADARHRRGDHGLARRPSIGAAQPAAGSGAVPGDDGGAQGPAGSKVLAGPEGHAGPGRRSCALCARGARCRGEGGQERPSRPRRPQRA